MSGEFVRNLRSVFRAICSVPTSGSLPRTSLHSVFWPAFSLALHCALPRNKRSRRPRPPPGHPTWHPQPPGRAIKMGTDCRYRQPQERPHMFWLLDRLHRSRTKCAPGPGETGTATGPAKPAATGPQFLDAPNLPRASLPASGSTCGTGRPGSTGCISVARKFFGDPLDLLDSAIYPGAKAHSKRAALATGKRFPGVETGAKPPASVTTVPRHAIIPRFHFSAARPREKP